MLDDDDTASATGPDTEPALVLTLLEDSLDGRAPGYWNPGAGPRQVASTASTEAPAVATQARWSPSTDLRALEWPTVEPVPSPDPVAAPVGLAPSPSDPSSPAPSPASAQRQRAKAERRAKVRQRQLRGQRDAALPATAAPGDVLLLEPDAASRTAICALLEAFGFRPHMAVSVGEAMTMSLQRRYAAVLLGLGTRDEDTPDLCHRLRRLPSFGATPVLAIGDAGHHAERVRMRLAGAHDTLLRPVSRGTLARSLHDQGVVMPRDPRAGGAPAA